MQNIQGKDSKEANFLGIYVHVPFCAHKCAFCGFFRELPHRGNMDKYVETLVEDVCLQHLDRKADTIYFGGGTPSILSTNHMRKIGEILSTHNPVKEWAIECSPGTVTREKIEAFRDIGMTRITLGIQSFNEKTMAIIGRRQTLQQIFTAYDTIRSCGFQNVGFDLIFSIPGQSFKSWEADLQTAISMEPEHISTYNLSFEKNSELGDSLRAGKIFALRECTEVKFFMKTHEILTQHGFTHYEISNFSKPGYESLHNMHTWEMNDWIGYGPSASSQLDRERFTNIPSLKDWHDGIRTGKHNRYNFQRLDEATLIQDSLIFGLRMTRGVNLECLGKRFPSFNIAKYDTFFNLLAANELAHYDDTTLRLTLKGLLVADAIAVEILSA
jgi:oxygen-independent coproporphyrinogen-3 oxidase